MATRDGKPSIEYRTLCRAGSVGADGEGKMSGKAAPFGQQTMIGKAPWGFREKINPAAWNKSIADGDIVLLDNHDTAKPMARMSAGTLRLEARGDGAFWDADPVDTQYSRDAQANIRANNYGGCSFGFEVVRDKWTVGDDGIDERELLEVKVHEISTVTFPAYIDTEASMRDAVSAAREGRTEQTPPESTPPADPAAELIRQYNELPEDKRAEVLAAITTPEKTSEPDESTREDEERENALYSHRAWAAQPR